MIRILQRVEYVLGEVVQSILPFDQAVEKLSDVIAAVVFFDHGFVDDDAVIDAADRGLRTAYVDYAGCLRCHGIGGHDALHVHEGRFEAHLCKQQVQ